MSTRGLRVDMATRAAHDARVSRQQEAVREIVLDHPQVTPHLGRRLTDTTAHLESLKAQRDADIASKKALRAAAPAGSRRAISLASPFTAEIARARTRQERSCNFNPGSSPQKAWLLYDCFGLPPQYRDESLTTDKRALNHLKRLKAGQQYRDVIEALQQYEHLDQILTTFIRAKVRDGRIYTAYRIQTGSGRVASGSDSDEKALDADTNQQNWPDEIRDIIIPDEGNTFSAGDWKQVEWLVMLNLAGDHENFRRVIEGEDQHCALASAIFEIPYHILYEGYQADDPDCLAKRQIAKKGRHGLSYGMGPEKMADETGISLDLAQQIVAADRRLYPLVAAYKEALVKEAKRKAYLETPFGWRRWFLEPRPDVPKILAFMPSATAADMLKIRLPWIAEMARRHGGWLATTTHDSFLIEIPQVKVEEAKQELKHLMELPFKRLGGTPFPAEVGDGANWKIAA